MKKRLGISFSKRIIAVLSLICLFLALLPLYRLTLYTIPRYDDFGYGRSMWEAQRYGYGIGTILKVGFETAKGFHYSWQGTYSSIFMMAQMPGALGFQYYFIGPVILITSLVVSVMFMSMVLTGAYLKGDVWDRITFSVIVTLTLTECIYTAQQGFFWYNSGVHYVFMHSMMFIMVGIIVILSRIKNMVGRIILALILAFFSLVCAGANFVTCIQGILILAGFILILLVTDPKKTIWYLPSFFVYAYGLRLSLLAPGNANRQASYMGLGVKDSIISSFKAGFENLWNFSGPFVLALLLMAVPVIWMMVKKTDFKFRFPWLFSVLSYCFYCTGFTSSFYSMGNAGLSRTWIAVCFSYQALLFANEVYWLGYIAHTSLAAKISAKTGMRMTHSVLHYVVVLAILFIAFKKSTNPIGAVSSFGAYYYIHTGEAYAFHEEFLDRVRIIEESDHKIVDVPEYGYMPWFLINRDITDDPNNEENRMMAIYFGAEGIRSVPRDEYYGR